MRPHPAHRLRELALRRNWSHPALRILQADAPRDPGGFDTFTRSMIDWSDDVAPVLGRNLPTMLMLSVFGVAELVAGILVATAPRLGE